jgi:hypothetical protein
VPPRALCQWSQTGPLPALCVACLATADRQPQLNLLRKVDFLTISRTEYCWDRSFYGLSAVGNGGALHAGWQVALHLKRSFQVHYPYRQLLSSLALPPALAIHGAQIPDRLAGGNGLRRPQDSLDVDAEMAAERAD